MNSLRFESDIIQVVELFDPICLASYFLSRKIIEMFLFEKNLNKL